MKTRFLEFSLIVALTILLSSLQSVVGIRFVIDREECFSHKVEYEGDTIHFSFVVIKSEGSWHYAPDGVDLLVKGPSGEQLEDFRDKTSEKSEFMARQKGVHQFCFINKSPYHETIDFDVHEAHFSYYDQHAKDEHFNPLLEQISKLEEALYKKVMGAEEESREVNQRSGPNPSPNPHLTESQFLSWKRQKDADASARKAEAARKRAEDIAAGIVQMNGRELFLHEPSVFDNNLY